MRRLLPLALLCSATLLGSPRSALAQTGPLSAGHGQFLLNGKPFQIIAGSMHYARVPREYWRDRMLKARAMGLNTITTYVFWNYHEPVRGHFDFTGNRDLGAYLQAAQDAGLHVILRPGPYVCAEWELGGYPGWLFADTSIVLRSTDPHFTRPAEQWLDTLGKVVAPYFASHGGPVIAVQVENEYGSFDRDTNYMRWQVDALKHAGFTDVYLFTADGPGQLPHGTLPDLPAVVNLGPGGAERGFATLANFRPDTPLMIGEYWAGWFDQWGHPHSTTNARQEADELRWVLSHGYSINLYMWHGGTTPGFLNGANSNGRNYDPQTSSYDYDAALDESGRPSRKYAMFRDVIADVTGVTPPPVPGTPPTMVVPEFALRRLAGFSDLLPAPVHVERPRNMETFGQSYGDILYRTHLDSAVTGDLVIRDVRDYAQVYVNGRLRATLDRRYGENTVTLDVPAAATLDILVENSGRVNFAKPLRDEEKGITHSVWLAGRELTGWDVYANGLTWLSGAGGTGGTCPGDPRPCLEADQAGGASAVSPALDGPAYYSGTFTADLTRDTFLDLRGWGKGTVWVNGHQLGRFWGIGPEQTLYVPGPWLHQGRNDVVVYDLLVPDHATLRGLDHPILADLHPDDRSR